MESLKKRTLVFCSLYYLILILGTAFCDAANIPNTPVNIPDPCLEIVIRKAVGKAEGTITKRDLRMITDLEAPDNNIRDITGIEHCVNLERLIIGGTEATGWNSSNKIQSISPLSGLIKIVKLSLRKNQIRDLTPLSSLSNIIELDIGENCINDISPLTELSKLEKLDLGGNQINDISALSILTNLKELILNVNQISDISPLSGLENLTKLCIGRNWVRNIEHLSGLKNLAVLYLFHNRIKDISPLSSLTNLQELWIPGNRISDISPLSRLDNLNILLLWHNNISNIQALVENEGLSRGDRIDLRYNPLNKISINTYIPILRKCGINVEYMDFYQYPVVDELKELKFLEDWLWVRPLNPDDIDSVFTNIDDLEWLKPIAQNSKVILLSEGFHYSQTIQHLVNRIIFALNTFDRYPILIMEYPYSLSAFWEYYIALKDDQEAKNFYQNVMYDMVNEEEIYDRLEFLRHWNKIHPDRRIHIAGCDIDWDYITTLRWVVIPYFRITDPAFNIKLDVIRNRPSKYYWDTFLGDLEDRLKKAKSRNVTGPYPFMTPEYMECVIENIRARFLDDRRILANLTDTRFLGKYLRDEKVLIQLGKGHTKGNEGLFLSSDFEPTKGRTSSILFQCFAYSLGAMKHLDLNSCLFHGEDYKSNVEKLQTAYQKGMISPEKYYLPGITNEFEKLIFRKAYDYEHRPLLVENMEWNQLIEEASKSSPELCRIVKSWKNEFTHYDAQILIPRTYITQLKRQKASWGEIEILFGAMVFLCWTYTVMRRMVIHKGLKKLKVNPEKTYM